MRGPRLGLARQSARRLALVSALAVPIAVCHAEPTGANSGAAADAAPANSNPWRLTPSNLARPNAILVFAGRLSTTDMASTLIFNLAYKPVFQRPPYDNSIVGFAYERDLFEIKNDVRLRVEGGLAERFGHYLVCCVVDPHGNNTHPDSTVEFTGRMYSTEAWFGGKLRWENFRPTQNTHLSVAATVGLSGVTRTMGRERAREIDAHGNAHLLGYVSPEVNLAFDSLPNWEFVLRETHRSGALGTFGHMREGYNANVLGVRYIF